MAFEFDRPALSKRNLQGDVLTRSGVAGCRVDLTRWDSSIRPLDYAKTDIPLAGFWTSSYY